ncbi:MAG: 4-aminobutyrate--2-oxoglutarate transaminase [bacterium]|jgi:4-aminobutyrate aminotransferase/(S)-3-amino-2-methylpropionate transaminase
MVKDRIDIKTPIPGPKSVELGRRRQKCVPRGAANATPIFPRRGSGAVLEDVDGNSYLDFAGGIGVLNVGYSHPAVLAAVQEQMESYLHTCFAVLPYEPYIELAERIGALLPGFADPKVLFLNSGAEAVENAVKIARAYTRRPAVIAFENAFHGRTLLTMSLTAKVNPYKYNFGPFAPEIYRLPYPYCYRCPFGLRSGDCGLHCLEYIEEAMATHVAPEDVAAMIVETVIGEGGFIVPPPEFIPGLKRICEKHGILYVADEIQSGYGRTGKMFAYEHYGIVPDLVTMAKSIAAGMPLSAVAGKAEIMDTPIAGGLGGTYSGNPVACAAGIAVLDILAKEDLLHRAAVLGQYARERFRAMQAKYPLIGDVRGLGAMMAIELVQDRTAKVPATEATKQVMQYCYEQGVILVKAGMHDNIVRLLVPLVITDAQMAAGMDVIEAALASLPA